MKLRTLLVTLWLLGSNTSQAQTAAKNLDWPQWRGPQGLGISEQKNLPTEWSAEKNIAWKTPLPGRGHSSPIVWGNRIFLTTDIEEYIEEQCQTCPGKVMKKVVKVVPGAKAVKHLRNNQPWVHPDSLGADRFHTLKVLCIERDTGKLLWEQTAYEGAAFDDRHRKNTYASGTPITDGKYVYAFFEAEGLYCYDFDGKLVWQSSLGKFAKMGMGPGTSPVLYENLLFLQCDQEDGGPDLSFLVAVDKRTGKEVWRVKRNHRKTHSTPLIVNTGKRVELITSGWETVISYDPATGKELWRCDGVKGWAIPSAVANQEMVFVASGYPTKRTIGIKLGGSGDLNDTPQVVWSYNKGTAYVASPILYGDYLYLIDDKGILTCIDPKTGAIKYAGGRVPTPESFSASPVAFEDKLLLVSEDGNAFFIKAGPKHEVLKVNSLNEMVLASPALAYGQIFIRGDKHLYCIGEPQDKRKPAASEGKQ